MSSAKKARALELLEMDNGLNERVKAEVIRSVTSLLNEYFETDGQARLYLERQPDGHRLIFEIQLKRCKSSIFVK